MNSVLGEIVEDFISLFFPNYCLACYGSLVKGEEVVCTHCMLEMPMTNYHQDINNSLKERLSGRIELKYALAMFKFSKSGRVQHLLHALKYKNHPEVGIMLGKVYGQRLAEAGLAKELDLILPVPLHESRNRKRGYNQSAKFAEGLSEKLNVPFFEMVLERKVITQTQTRKSKLNRWKNVSDVFHLKDEQAILDKRILLVDDVVTTGATLEACILSLEPYCAAISIACIAEA